MLKSMDANEPTNLATKARGDAHDALPLERVGREHAADRIVHQLGALILRGELRDGEALPSERILAERFGVARGTVRQAVHKLADWGLLHTRQGGITRIANVEEAQSAEVVELRARLGPMDAREKREWVERRMLQGVAIVALAEQHVDVVVLDDLASQIDALEAASEGADAWTIEGLIWSELAKMSKNRLFIREVKWWSRVTKNWRDDASASLMTPTVRGAFYRELFRRLRAGDHAARYFLEMTQLLLKSTSG
jgi:DNA-binding FadR family transcriptional regulator